MIWRAVYAQMRGIRNWDWRAVSACSVLALFIWVFNALNKSYNTVIPYPVRFETRQAKVAALMPPPSHIEVNVTGTGWNLLRKVFNLDVETVVLEVTNPLSVRFMLTRSLQPMLAKAMRELSITGFVSDSIHFHYEPVVDKTVLIKLRTTDVILDDGYRIVSSIDISPDKTLISGPASLLAQLGDTLWANMSQKSVSENFYDQLSLNFTSSQNSPLVRANVTKVEVRFEVGHFTPQQAVVPIELIGFPADSSVWVQPKVLMVKYFLLDGESAPAEDIRVLLDFKDLKKYDSLVAPSQVLPKGLRFPEISPPLLKVHYANHRSDRRNRSR